MCMNRHWVSCIMRKQLDKLFPLSQHVWMTDQCFSYSCLNKISAHTVSITRIYDKKWGHTWHSCHMLWGWGCKHSQWQYSHITKDKTNQMLKCSLFCFRWKCVGGGNEAMGSTRTENSSSTRFTIKEPPSSPVGHPVLSYSTTFRRPA